MKIREHAAEVTLITPTGHRPQAFALCQRWMARQTFPGTAQWIVISDEFPFQPQQCTMGQLFIGRWPKDSDPRHTLSLNLHSALPQIKSDLVLIIEDDDWYAPEYVETMLRWLTEADLVGEVGARYYHLKYGYRHFRSHSHASLCRTGFTVSVMETLVASIEHCIRRGSPSIDLRLWRTWKGSKKKVRPVSADRSISIGIKGMPGRKSHLHRRRPGYRADPEFKILKSLVRDDWETYARLIYPQGHHSITMSR